MGVIEAVDTLPETLFLPGMGKAQPMMALKISRSDPLVKR